MLALVSSLGSCGQAEAGASAAAAQPASTYGPTSSSAYPAASPPPGMSFVTLLTAKMMARAAFAYSGGAFGDQRVFSQGAILVRHPRGNLLFDAGFGRNVDRHFETVPWLMRVTSRYDKLAPAVEQLSKAGIEPTTLKAVVLTHAHWDHVSGLEDLPRVPVWVNQQELEFARRDIANTVLARQIGLQNYRVYGFPSGPYLSFDRSYDVFGDGSVVLVQAPGHTPGSIVAFIHTPDGKHYALIGDLVWQREGIEQTVGKPWLISKRVDEDPDQTLTMIRRIHAIKRQHPDLIVVPAHDQRVWQSLPRL